MQPTLHTISPFWVSGPKVRTANRDEVNPDTAKIAWLWKDFFHHDTTRSIPNQTENNTLYGVYSSYASDANDFFDVSVAMVVSTPNTQFPCVEIQGGRYLAFPATGPMPQAVIQTWGVIWAYFEQHSEHQRRYDTDFERYEGPESAVIYIGIQ